MTGAGNGYLSGNMLVPFPFEDGLEMAWMVPASVQQDRKASIRSAAQEAFNRCFADASVYVLGSAFDGRLPEVGNVSFSGTTLSFSIIVGDRSTGLSVSASGK